MIASLEARIAAAEERAADAERRLNQRSSGRPRTVKQNGGHGSDPEAAVDGAEGQSDPEKPPVDGSELRSRLVRSTDARRRGSSTPAPDRTPAPKPR